MKKNRKSIIRKMVDKYMKHKDLMVVNQKEYENMIKYRATRGELKNIIDDFNELLDTHIKMLSIKALTELAKENKLETKNKTKEELQMSLIETLQKEFKKAQ